MVAVSLKKKEKDKRPVRSPFESSFFIDNQTIVIPAKKSIEFVIQHRFGTLQNSAKDLFGMYAPSNIRLGLSFTPLKNLQIGLGTTKNDMLQDGYVKWAILQQTRSGSMPVALTYYGNVVINAGDKDNFEKSTHRFSYFHQLLIARKFNDMFSFQVAPGFVHYNLIDTTLNKDTKHDNFIISVLGRAKITSQLSILVEYDQQLTTPEEIKPNLAFGIELSTGSHAFQIFIGSFDAIINNKNAAYNTYDFNKGEMRLGFNISRLWSF